jgi:hypothetical protein
MRERREHDALTVRTDRHALHGEDYIYLGEVPAPGDVIVAEGKGGPVSVRVTDVIEVDSSHRIDGIETD